MIKMPTCLQCETEQLVCWQVRAEEIQSGNEFNTWICTKCFQLDFGVHPAHMTDEQFFALPPAFAFDGEA